MVNQATVIPASTAAWSRASQKWLFPVPEGPQMHTFSRRPTHSRLVNASWVGRGMQDAPVSQSCRVFPAGNPAR